MPRRGNADTMNAIEIHRQPLILYRRVYIVIIQSEAVVILWRIVIRLCLFRIDVWLFETFKKNLIPSFTDLLPSSIKLAMKS